MSQPEPRVAFLLAGPLAFCPAFSAFLAHNDYGLARAEVLLAAAVVVTVGLAAGALLARWAGWPRYVGTALLVIVAVDLHAEWVGAMGLLGLAALVPVLAGGAWAFRSHLGALLCAVFGALLVTSFFVPGAGLWPGGAPEAAGAAEDGRPELPPIVHVILDEHIGIEGIPAEFDPEGTQARELGDALVARGFAVFGRAFSRYYDTSESIPNTLNFAAETRRMAWIAEPGGRTRRVTANALLERLRERGYLTHVIQSDFLDICRAGGLELADTCTTYTLETVDSIEETLIPAWSKARMLLASFARLSSLVRRARDQYTRIRGTAAGTALGLPPWPAAYERISSVSGMRALDTIEERLRGARSGEAYLVHLMLPHYPYAWDADCRLRLDPGEWLYGEAPEAAPRRNTPESRRIRYPLYLDQLRCTHRQVHRLLDALEAAGAGDEAVVILHGDHGSRLDLGPPTAQSAPRLSVADFADGFSTLFAAKLPGQAPGYDHRLLPVDALVRHATLSGAVPGGTEWAPPPAVLLDSGTETLTSHPLPPFGWSAPAAGPEITTIGAQAGAVLP